MKTRYIPALCDSCGALFNTGISYQLEIEGMGEVMGVKGTVGCPSCGGSADFRTDLFSFVKDSFEYLSKMNLPQMIKLRDLLLSRHRRDLDEDGFNRLKDDIASVAPELRTFSDLMPKTRIEAFTLIGLLIQIVVAVITFRVEGKKETVNPIIEKVLQNKEITIIQNQTVNNYGSELSPNMSLNAKCHCGSGLKYKRCHGKERKRK